jgi:hypothetical protein
MRFFVHAPTDGVPYVGSVMTPPLTRPATSQSRGRVYGQPGTQAIYVPNSDLHRGLNTLANNGVFNTSVSPQVIFPSLYYEAGNEYGNHEHAPVSRCSDNQMPVPALRAPNVIVFKAYTSRKGGQRQVTQPQVVQRFPGLRGTASG